MNETFMVVGVLYLVFSMLFSLMWVDAILYDKSFVGYYRNSIKNKNTFGKTYVTIFYLIALPSYLIAMGGLYVTLFLQWVYDLGIKSEEENE